MPEIKLRNVTKRWGKFYAVENLSMDIEDNSFITLLGPSGCGKTTTLRMIAGLETPTSGQITIGDKVVFDSEQGINIPANKRKVGFLFQNYALWPNMTVYQNIAFGLSNIKEEMPSVDFTAKKLMSEIEVFSNYKEYINIIIECTGKDGKIDKTKACLKIIDTYTVSMYTAKEIFAMKLHEGKNPSKNFEDARHKALAQYNDLIKKHEAVGETLNENCEVVKDGKVVTTERKLSKEEIDLSVRRVSRIVKIGMFMDRYPAELSGGQQQRVAIARTLAPEPQVLFMDEPLSNLDAKLRLEMRYELQRLHLETGSTFVYVTHDQMEAMTLATKICLINNGVLQQYDAPLDVYHRPNNLFVADFVGNPSINFVDAKGAQEGNDIAVTIFDNIKAKFKPNEPLNLEKWQKERSEAAVEAAVKLKELAKDKKYVEKGNKDEVFKYHVSLVEEEDYSIKEAPVPTNEDFVIGIRPEAIKVAADGVLDGIIYGAMPTGMESTLKIAIGNYLLTGVVFGSTIYQIGETEKINIDGNDILLFDKVSGKVIATGSLEVE